MTQHHKRTFEFGHSFQSRTNKKIKRVQVEWLDGTDRKRRSRFYEPDTKTVPSNPIIPHLNWLD